MMKLQIMSKVMRFLKDEGGPTSVEYAVIVMLILGAVITVVQLMANETGESLGNSSDQLDAAFTSSEAKNP